MVQRLIPPRGWIVPMPPHFWESLHKVEGIYEMSGREAMRVFSWAVAYFATFAFATGLTWREFERTKSSSDGAIAVSDLVMMFVVAWWLLPRIWVKYDVRDGRISRVSTRGEVLWRESFANVPRVVLCNDNLNRFITLRWPERRRTFLVPDSLAKAIDEARATSNNSLERTREG